MEDLIGDREPDFFELLKAAINAGSLGKSSGTGIDAKLGDAGAYQHSLDISTDYQIIQIGANIIDQSDADGFPTWIKFNGHDFYGAENLPGLYRTTYSWALKKTPVFASPNSPPDIINPLPVGTYFQPIAGAGGTSALTDGGSIALILVPHIWNPHDQNDIAARGTATFDPMGTPRPGNLTISASSNLIPGTAPYKVVSTTHFYASDGSEKLLQSPLPGNTVNATLTFGDAAGSLFREPTMLWKKDYPIGSNLTGSTEIPSPLDGNQTFTGFCLNTTPAYWSNGSETLKAAYTRSMTSGVAGDNGTMVFTMQYQDLSGAWKTYDSKWWDTLARAGTAGCFADPSSTNPRKNGAFMIGPEGKAPGSKTSSEKMPIGNPSSDTVYVFFDSACADPRTARWVGANTEAMTQTIFDDPTGINPNFSVVMTNRPGRKAMSGESFHANNTTPGTGGSGLLNIMFYDTTAYSITQQNMLAWGMFTQNNFWATYDTSTTKQFYADADGVVRRAMAAYVPFGKNLAATQTLGLPMATATAYSSSNGTVIAAPTSAQSQSRPIILNRPFKTVDELGYTFKGTPWKNLDFFTPESGDTALLDVFCIGDNAGPDGMVAGKVNLNTRQKPVLQAVLAGSMHDELTSGSALSSSETANIASKLYARTTGTNVWQGPLANVGELVGRFVGNQTVTGISTTFPANPPTGYYLCKQGLPGQKWISLTTMLMYSGLSADLDSSTVFTSHPNAEYIQRLRQSAIRPLAACGQTRCWNLLIDLVAQAGRYPQAATKLENFLVEGEKRYWLHLALDRLTGQVIDSQLEVVSD